MSIVHKDIPGVKIKKKKPTETVKEKVEYDKMYYLWRTSWGKGVNSYNVKCGYHSGRENNLLDISIDCLD